jgi:hypothetical protein
VGLQERSSIIDQLATELKAPVLAYVTGDRTNLQTQVASDAVVRFIRHLRHLGDAEQLVLLLYTRGGEVNAAWPLVNALRAHCKRLLVVLPMVAHSAGTLITLGADEVHMSRYATLSPIDPTVTNQYNSTDPLNPAQRLPIAVEDVLAYLELAKAHDGHADAFRRLSEQIHPLALGNVQRSINQIKGLAARMLSLHEDPPSVEDTATLVSRLTTELYSHSHLIGRVEAKSMGFPVVEPAPQVEELLFQYWTLLVQDLQLDEAFDPAALLRAAPTPVAPQVVQPPGTTPGLPQLQGLPVPLPGSVPPGAPGIQLQGLQPTAMPSPKVVPVRLERGYIETRDTCDAFVVSGEIREQTVPGQQTPFGLQPAQNMVAFEIHSDRWVTVR